MSFLTSLRPAPQAFTSLLRQQSRRGLARITIIGRMADTPEKQATASGQTLIKYALATNSGPRENRQTSWWRVAAFTQSEKMEELMMGLGKGTLLAVEGDCSIGRYTAKDGSSQQALNISQKSMEILDKRGNEEMMEGEELQAASG